MKTELDIFKPYKDQIMGLTCIIATLIIMLFLMLISFSLYVTDTKEKLDDCQSRIEEIQEIIEEAETVEVVEAPAPVLASRKTPVAKKEKVYFTNYYTGADGSTTRTGSGLDIYDFEINEKGWYTYEGKVVIAAATNEGLRSNYGVLAKYNKPEPGIRYYDYFEEFQIEVDGVIYDAICLDTCGASMNINYLRDHDGGVNRLDIFIAHKKYSFGKVEGHTWKN